MALTHCRRINNVDVLTEQFRQVHLQACDVEEISVVVEFDKEVIVAPVGVFVSGHRANQRYRSCLGAFRGGSDRCPMSLKHGIATVHVLDCTGAVADDRLRAYQLGEVPPLDMVTAGV